MIYRLRCNACGFITPTLERVDPPPVFYCPSCRGAATNPAYVSADSRSPLRVLLDDGRVVAEVEAMDWPEVIGE